MVVRSSLEPPLLERTFQIRNGATTDLGDLPLPPTTRVYRVAVTSAGSRASLSGGFLVRARGAGTVNELFKNPPLHTFLFGNDGPQEFHDGAIRFISAETALDVVVAAPGYRGVVVAAHPGAQEVQLPLALRVPLRIADFQGLPREPYELRVRLALDGDSDSPFTLLLRELRQLGWSSPFDENGVAEVLVPGPGVWRLTWLVDTRSSGFVVDWFEGRETSVQIGDEEPCPELLLHAERDTTKCGKRKR
jgi:hypothetical protein